MIVKIAVPPESEGAVKPTIVGSATPSARELNDPLDLVTWMEAGVLLSRANVNAAGVALIVTC
jgi:hypothetical protein